MSTKMASPLTSAVAGGVIPLPRGVGFADGTEVLIVPLEWMRRAERKSAPSRRHRFASEDLVGCHTGDGMPATNAAARALLRRRRA